MATEIPAGSPASRAARLAIPLAVVAALVAARPEIATGTFSSVTSVAKVVALVAVWMGFSWLVRRFVANTLARTAIIATVGAGLLAVTVLPYFREKTVDDPFPAVAAPAVTETTAAVPAPAVTSAAAPTHAPATTVQTPITPSGPVKLATGQLRGLAGHRGSGEVAIYRQPDGSLLVRFEDFDVSSVPAPVVYLVPGPNQQRPGGVKLGALRGNNGNLNIALPAGTEVNGPHTVLIWCEAFSVPVAGATAA
ncbi:MAG: DM13 domain-containing protein [Acidimicrobiales bacterium]